MQRLAAEEREVAAARDFVRGRIAALGMHAVDGVDLLTSEVVSNAIEHAVTAGVVVRVVRCVARVRVEVHDDDSMAATGAALGARAGQPRVRWRAR